MNRGSRQGLYQQTQSLQRPRTKVSLHPDTAELLNQRDQIAALESLPENSSLIGFVEGLCLAEVISTKPGRRLYKLPPAWGSSGETPMGARALLFLLSFNSALPLSEPSSDFHTGGWQVAVHGYSDCSKALSLKKQCVSSHWCLLSCPEALQRSPHNLFITLHTAQPPPMSVPILTAILPLLPDLRRVMAPTSLSPLSVTMSLLGVEYLIKQMSPCPPRALCPNGKTNH